MRIDLHTHSSESDGTDPVPGLLAAASAAGLDVVALTDHDTTAGWAAAQDSRPPGLTVVPGVELSCASPVGDGPPIGVHLLGYLIDPGHEGLRAEMARLRETRVDRAAQMVGRMAEAGLPVDWPTVRAIAGTAPVGRPHMALALVRAGWAATVTEAFERYLHHTSPYYVRKHDTSVADAVRLVRSAGGVPVLAHPLARRRGRVVGDDVLADLVDVGLLGLEVDHPDHDADDRVHLRGLAAELGLICTGASDYHGTNKTTPIGAESTAPGVLDRLVAAATGTAPYAG